ncbi:acyltransferase [Caballeronia terrestris]|uniref:Acyltransferase n=1 Tax=Caballeronia terrestris TaxID=1226301 RepID=A0A158FAX0_9BURK|nr:acyltransferase [Caballeronia terrestris]SAL16160.1 acyltransferase [Caballeronia terrestris]
MATSSRANNSRVFGLDLLRACAVLSVVIGHTLDHGAPANWIVRYVAPQAVTGVELFYVLSGFLIGHILIRSVQAGKLHSKHDIIDFWKRRWARTLPAYVFFLLLYLRFDYHGPADLTKVWPFFLFLQNLAWPTLPFFTHSWSLAVEEWFYLLLPLTFLGFVKLFKTSGKSILATALVFIFIPLVARVVFSVEAEEWAGFDSFVRSIVICRLDSLFIGVLLAYVRINHPETFNRIANFWPVGLLALVGLVTYLSIGVPYLEKSRLIRIAFFPLFSVSIAFVIPALIRLESTGLKLLDVAITHTSKVSYSLYLGHISMLTLLLAIMDKLGWSAKDGWSTLLMYFSLAIFYFAFATLTYEFVEQPYIRLRDRLLGHSDERSGNFAVNSTSNTPRDRKNPDARIKPETV